MESDETVRAMFINAVQTYVIKSREIDEVLATELLIEALQVDPCCLNLSTLAQEAMQFVNYKRRLIDKPDWLRFKGQSVLAGEAAGRA